MTFQEFKEELRLVNAQMVLLRMELHRERAAKLAIIKRLERVERIAGLAEGQAESEAA